MRMRLQNKALPAFSFLAYLLILVLATIIIDGQLYQNAKKELIHEEYFEKFPIFDQQFSEYLTNYLNTEVDHVRKRNRELLRGKMVKILKSSSPILEFQVRRDKEIIFQQKREDGTDFNTFKNSLILGNFKSVARSKIPDLSGQQRFAGELVFYYTTPKDYAPIEALTREYRLYLYLTLLTITLAYLLTLRVLILPIKKVSQAIQASGESASAFIRHPHTQFEWLYNSMARDAMLMTLTQDPKKNIRFQLRSTFVEDFERMQPLILQWFNFSDARILHLRWDSPRELSLLSCLPPCPDGKDAFWGRLTPAFHDGMLRNLRTSYEAKTPHLYESEQDGQSIFAGEIPTDSSERQMRLLVLTYSKRVKVEEEEWQQETAQRIYEQLRDLAKQKSAQSRELFQEKSEANINLSRNLGHDLTNIIATNKLELMTVGQVLRQDSDDWLDSPKRRHLVLQTMERILDNTRSLQEIVNLYRAYEYLKHPRYEETELVEMVGDIIDIFRLSMSSAAQIEYDQGRDKMHARVEPRLLKLALFNLLSNAQDAIRRLPPEEQAGGKIYVHVDEGDDKEYILIKIADTGPGIRTASGELADDEEINRIFELGYTTKAGGHGEGLGLNWVKAIMTEFHTGELRASNQPEGGAVFECRLPKEPAHEKADEKNAAENDDL